MPRRRTGSKPSQTPYQPLLPLAPVDNLVDDTLRIIFEQCCLVARGHLAFYKPREVLKICLVSRRWNRVARDHAVFWTHIHIEQNRLAQLQFRLSRNAPLQVIYGSASYMCQHSPPLKRMSRKTVDDIEENMYRVELLSFSAHPDKLEHLTTVHYLMPILFSTHAPQLKSWYMDLKGGIAEDGKFKEILAWPFRDHELQLRNIYWGGYRPSDHLRFFNGLTRLVVKERDWQSTIEIDLLSILQSNPALDELVILGTAMFSPTSGTLLEMECLKTLHLNSFRDDHLELFLRTVSLPVIQNLNLVITPRNNDEEYLPMCFRFRDAFLECPHLCRLLSFPESLSLSTSMLGFTIDAVGPTLHKVCIVAEFGPLNGVDLFYHILDMFSNLNRLCVDRAHLLTGVNIGSSPGIKTFELFGARAEQLKSLNEDSSLPSLSHLILKEPVLESDDDWTTVLDLFPESELHTTCTIITLSPMNFPLSNKIREDMKRRNIHFEIQTPDSPN